ncbi:MAG: DNA-binding protein [Clostridia bacterium]|nr:DNA-binding protein [Clostridia bacterium]
MEFKRFGDTYMVRIDRGEEIMETLATLCRDEKIHLAQVDAIGAADQALIGVYNLQAQAYHEEELSGFMEITNLSGSITFVDEKPYIHLHAALAGGDHTVHGGHVLRMRVGATCEMFVRTLDGNVSREKDPGLGINLWKFS